MQCPKCNASVKVSRTSKRGFSVAYFDEIILCQEIKNRVAAGEESIRLGECSAMTKSIKSKVSARAI